MTQIRGQRSMFDLCRRAGGRLLHPGLLGTVGQGLVASRWRWMSAGCIALWDWG